MTFSRFFWLKESLSGSTVQGLPDAVPDIDRQFAERRVLHGLEGSNGIDGQISAPTPGISCTTTLQGSRVPTLSSSCSAS